MSSTGFIKSQKTQGIHIPELVLRFLRARGILNLEDQYDFITASLKKIKSPFVLSGMDKACVRLAKALENQESIGIYCDYDMDGSSAAALLLDGFAQLGFKKLFWYQPRRLKEGYGFHKTGVDYFLNQEVSLIVTVDVGITAHETVEYAKKNNIDVIVTDHHLPDRTLPEALSIINPNSGICNSSMGYLCGAGVAFYLVYGLGKFLKDNNYKISKEFKLESLLDLLVIGTLTDMVPLVKENRALVKRGLTLFSTTDRVGLRALKARAGLLGKQIGSLDIGFKIAPKLNSLSRLDTDLRPTEILIEKNSITAEKLVSKAYEINESRVSFLEEGLKEALDFFKENQPQRLCYYISKNIHPGVMGLIATRVVEEYGLPSFIGSELDESKTVVGSARLPKNTGLSLKEMMSFCPSLLQYGGHKEAAGFELEYKRKNEFKNQLIMYLEEHYQKENYQSFVREYDCEVYLSELDYEFKNWLKNLEPFGVEFEQPLFKIADLEIVSVKKLKEKHYKFIIADKRGATFEVLWFSPPKEHEVSLVVESQSYTMQKFNFYVNPQINFFRGQESLQLLTVEVEVV